MSIRITNADLQWTLDRLRLDKIDQVLGEIDTRATEFAAHRLAVPRHDITPSHFGETVRTLSAQEGPRHSHMLFSERGELLLGVETQSPLLREMQQKVREMWYTHPGTLFLGLAAWYTFPFIAARSRRSPYMPGYWIEHFMEGKERLPWQEQTIYFVSIDKMLWEVRGGEWILPLFQIGGSNLTAQSLNRIRILVDMFVQAETQAKMILENEQRRLAMGSRALADIEEALAREGSEGL